MGSRHLVGIGPMRDYLLGKLDEQAAEALELQYFTSGAILLRLRRAEEALIRDYLKGRLSSEDRALFEQRCRTLPALATKVNAIRALTNAESSRVRWGRAILVPAAICLALVTGLWLHFRVAPPATHNRAQSQASINTPVLSLLLTAGVSRGPGSSEAILTLPATFATVKLTAQILGD